MKSSAVVLPSIVLVFMIQTAVAQSLPGKIKDYLDETYPGWKLSQSEDGCGPVANNGVVKGNFNGDRKKDYAVKFTQNEKGFIIAFMAGNKTYKSFILHDTDASDVNYSSLSVWKKGIRFELGEVDVVPKFDALSDFHCESDVGGIHVFENGDFVTY